MEIGAGESLFHSLVFKILRSPNHAQGDLKVRNPAAAVFILEAAILCRKFP
jgi:hypothetical protein